MTNNINYIFGYGSLVDSESLKLFLGRDRLNANDWQFCRLSGYRRIWNVSMNNCSDVNGYKYYIDPKSQIRPDISVTFLNVHIHSKTSIAGLLLQVSPDELELVDRRERNYKRIDVSENINIPVKGKAWVYIGLKESVERYRKAFTDGKAVISKSYYKLVYNAFLSYGKDSAADYLATTDAPKIPQMYLKLINNNYLQVPYQLTCYIN